MRISIFWYCTDSLYALQQDRNNSLPDFHKSHKNNLLQLFMAFNDVTFLFISWSLTITDGGLKVCIPTKKKNAPFVFSIFIENSIFPNLLSTADGPVYLYNNLTTITVDGPLWQLKSNYHSGSNSQIVDKRSRTICFGL